MEFEQNESTYQSAEHEDVILPDGFDIEEPQAEEPVAEEVDTTETEEQKQEEAFLKIKYNKEEIPLDAERARELAQMGMNYPKLQEKLQALETDPRLTFVEELAQEQGMDVNEFVEAMRSAREEQRLNELIEQNIPEEYAREILENKKFREQLQAEKKQQEEEQRKNTEAGEFFDYFKQANGRDFDPQKDQLPQEVWELTEQGVPMKYAYMQHHNSELQAQLKALKKNAENQKKAPVGSITEYGGNEPTSEDDFLRGFNSI